jgi:hypothetical protein
MSSKLTNNWEIVTDISIKSNRTTHDQLPKPVIPITNRYNALHNLQNDLELPRNIQNHHIKKNILSKQNKAINSPIRRSKRKLLIGDSHMHGCASELGKYLGPEYEVMGTIMPESRLQNVMKLARNEIAGFSNRDAVIIWGGSNDVNRNKTVKGLKYLNELVNQKKEHKCYDSNSCTQT